MQFRIPQFLDIEDQVFGPFTFKQFGYLLGAIAFAYIFWKLIPYKIVSVPIIFLFSGTFLALAFVKINSRPFADILESAYKFVLGNKTYVWQKEKTEEKDLKEEMRLKEALMKKEESTQEKKIDLEKIKELSSKLDILDEERRTNLSLREEIIKKKRNETNIKI